jgi:hypothetical protein
VSVSRSWPSLVGSQWWVLSWCVGDGDGDMGGMMGDGDGSGST